MNTKLGIYVVADVVSSLVGEVLMLWVYALGEKSENFPSDFLKLIWGFKCLCHRNSKALQNRMMINEAAKRGLRIIFFKLFMKMKQFDSFSHIYPKKHRNHKLIFIVLWKISKIKFVTPTKKHSEKHDNNLLKTMSFCHYHTTAERERKAFSNRQKIS